MASLPGYTRCGNSGLRSLIRWTTFGSGVVYGKFRLGHFFNVKRDMMIQQKETWESENKELKDQIAGLETEIYRLRNPDWNVKPEGADEAPTDELGKILWDLGFRSEVADAKE